MTTSATADVFLVPEGLGHTAYRESFWSVPPTQEFLSSLGLSERLRPSLEQPWFPIEQSTSLDGYRSPRYVVVRLNAPVGLLRAGYYVLLRMSVEKFLKIAACWRR